MRCPSCIEPGLLTCTGCNNVKYCSITCQQSDWQFHKVLCKSFVDFQQRPSPEMRRVIFLPTTGAKPEFRWLPVRDIGNEEEGFVETVDHKQLLKEDCFFRSTYCNRNGIIGTTLEMAIALRHDDAFLLKYTAPNTAVLAATNHKVGNVWRGPMLAHRGKTYNGIEIRKVEDMDLNSYSDLAAFLIDYHSDGEFHSDGKPCVERCGPKIEGVRTNCLGEQQVNGSPFVTKALIPRMHPIFDEGEVSGISQRIGMPLILWKHAAKKYPTYAGPGTGLSNEKVTFMMLICDPAHDRFGWAPLHWLGGQVHNVLVTRLNRQPLESDIFEAFGDFCRHHMQPYFEWACEIGGLAREQLPEAKQLVMDGMTPVKWNQYMSRWSISRASSAGGAGGVDGIAGLLEDLSVTSEKEQLHDRLWDRDGHPRSPAQVRGG